MSTRFIVPLLCLLLTPVSTVVYPAALAQSGAADPVVTLTGALHLDRYNHTATLLPDRKVLVAGGAGFPCIPCGSSGRSCIGNFCYSSVNNTAELYDPADGTWSLTGSH